MLFPVKVIRLAGWFGVTERIAQEWKMGVQRMWGRDETREGHNEESVQHSVDGSVKEKEV